MEKKYKYYFKVLNDELFGGKGSEGYMSLVFNDKEDNPIAIAKSALNLNGFSSDVEFIEISESDVEFIEISEEEYLKATEEE